MNCPHCGLSIVATPTKTNKALCLNADTSAMSETAMRAYYKSTAPASDAIFFANAIRNCGDRALIMAAERLALQTAAGTMNKADSRAHLLRLQARWRALDYRQGLSAEHNRVSGYNAQPYAA